MKKTSTLLCIGLAAACLTIVAVSRATVGAPAPYSSESAAAPSRLTAVTAYTLVQRQTYEPAVGRSFLRAQKTRLQRSDGVFVVTHTYYRPDGSTEVVETGVGFLGVGVFRAEERSGKLEFLAALGEENIATEDELKADADFVREEAVIGQRALVARRAVAGPNAGHYREVWRAPALQNFELKEIAASPLGTEVTEPVELRLGEPDAAPFVRLAHRPRSFARYEERIREAARRGEPELAERMRRHLERARR